MDFQTLMLKIQLPTDALESNWHQHKNPDGSLGGWVQNTAMAEPTAFIGPNAVIEGASQILDTSEVRDGARVIDAIIRYRSIIKDQAIVIGGEYYGEEIGGITVVQGITAVDVGYAALGPHSEKVSKRVKQKTR